MEEAVVAYFKLRSRHFPAEMEKTRNILSRYSRSPGRESNPGPI